MKVHAALQTMQQRLFALGGVVRQFLVDDKGTVCIGVFFALSLMKGVWSARKQT